MTRPGVPTRSPLRPEVVAMLRPAPVALADAASIATNAALGNHFRVTLGGNRTLANPTGGTDGQRALWEITQDSTGGRTLALGTAFRLGADITELVLSEDPGLTDFVGAVFHGPTGTWRVLAVARGYAL